MDDRPELNHGVALAAMSLMSALLEELRSEGVLTRQQVIRIIGVAQRYADLLDSEVGATADTQTAVNILRDMRRDYRGDAETGA